MAGTKSFADPGIGGQRQETTRCGEASPLDHHGSVMDGRGGWKDAAEQLFTDQCVEPGADLDVLVEPDLAFEHDQCP